ncbi:unannotated protein [freshwater metagenome]|uniref:Unannotated protein n=1 Tax=freshwater metagenome TaxID=449393 RepID=A0A6J7EVN9_9ZZZZ
MLADFPGFNSHRYPRVQRRASDVGASSLATVVLAAVVAVASLAVLLVPQLLSSSDSASSTATTTPVTTPPPEQPVATEPVGGSTPADTPSTAPAPARPDPAPATFDRSLGMVPGERIQTEAPKGPTAEGLPASATLQPAPPPLITRSGLRNGYLPPEALGRSHTGCTLSLDAAAAYEAMSLAAEADGLVLEHSGCYRTYEGQVQTRARWCLIGSCRFGAVPGTSMHGWGLAVDLKIGNRALEYTDTVFVWLTANSGRFGFLHPRWAEPSGSSPEPWHWEYGTARPSSPIAVPRPATPVDPALIAPVDQRVPA